MTSLFIHVWFSSNSFVLLFFFFIHFLGVGVRFLFVCLLHLLFFFAYCSITCQEFPKQKWMSLWFHIISNIILIHILSFSASLPPYKCNDKKKISFDLFWFRFGVCANATFLHTFINLLDVKCSSVKQTERQVTYSTLINELIYKHTHARATSIHREAKQKNKV